MPFSTRTAFPQQPKVTEQARRTLRLAWICLGMLPISFAAAMVLGDWLLSVQGYQSGDDEIPVGAVLSAGLPAVLVLVAPTLGAGWFGWRAKRLGHPNWLVPVVVATVIAAGSIALNLLQLAVAYLQTW